MAMLDPPDPKFFAGQLARPPLFHKQWMLAGNPALFFQRLSQDWGDFVHYRGLFSFYLVNHPALVKQVLQQTHKFFDKQTVIYNRFRVAFGDGLVVSEGDHWRQQRSRMQPMFGPKTVQQFFEMMVTATQDMVGRLTDAAESNPVFDIAQEMDRLTLGIAGQALFSDGFDQVADQIDHWTVNINRYSAKPPLPIIRQYWFPSRVNRRLKRTLAEFHSFIQNMIDLRRRDSANDQRNDLLSILLHARDDETDQTMSDQAIIEEVLGMIIGGHETSSAALTWIWYELDRHPEVAQRLFDEIDSVVGTDQLRLDHMPDLKFARMVIDECLRLHPPFWFENRNANQDIELGGTLIPKGSIVAFSRYSLHRHRTFWNQPNEFQPDRQNPEALEHSRSTYAQVPFGGGPRICIGINFAIMELVVILTVISQRHRVQVAKGNRVQMAAHLTMTIKHGLNVSLKDRS